MNVLFSVKSKTDSSAQHATIPVDGRLLLGRSPDSVVPLDGPGISREHLAIEIEGSTFYVTDVSSNGTWLNGKRLQNGRRSKARETDALEIPGYEIRIQLVEDAPAERAVTRVDNAISGSIPEAQAAAVPGRSSRAMLKSLTALELLLVFVAVVSFTLLLLYFTS